MPDRYRRFANSPLGGSVVRKLGLPRPTPLRRQHRDDPDVPGPVLLGGATDLREVLANRLNAEVHLPDDDTETTEYAGLLYDATAVTSAAQLRGLYDFFHPRVRRLAECGRVLVLGAVTGETTDPAAAAQAALDGFTRSLAKELRGGATAQLLRLGPGSRHGLESTLRFFLSYRSAFVSGQVITLRAPDTIDPDDPDEDARDQTDGESGDQPGPAGASNLEQRHRSNAATDVDPCTPLRGRVALVTGAARGIGAVTAATLARYGATVVCLDVPEAGEKLATVAGDVGGIAVQLNLTGDAAPSRLADWVDERYGGVDVVVHNAGITRDKTLARMSQAQWDTVLDVNLGVPQRVTAELLERGLLRDRGRVVVLSSVSGIAGNRGQSNYAASKAGLIGLVGALAPAVHDRGITANAVAPGFIETRMTAAMPLVEREGGRRLSSLAQGGLPVDVAETVAWLAHPGSSGVTGNVVRVCGQSMLGA